MTHVEYWYAFDDTEFLDRYECEEYEQQYIDMVYEIMRSYTFYDADMNILEMPCWFGTVDDAFHTLEDVVNRSIYVRRMEELSKAADKLERDALGLALNNEDFKNELGLFKWSFQEVRWEKVGD